MSLNLTVLQVGLEKLRYLVLDEADRMLDMGFEPDMRRLVGSPGMPSNENRQTLMFSATYPEDIQRYAASSPTKLASSAVADCLNMEVCVCRMAGDFLKADYLFLAVGVVGGACSDVEQTFIQVTKFSKRDQLLDLLKTTGFGKTSKHNCLPYLIWHDCYNPYQWTNNPFQV